MSYIRPVVTWAMAVLFCLAAVVQYNDPDPWLWIGIYTASVLITVWFATRTTMRASVPAIESRVERCGVSFDKSDRHPAALRVGRGARDDGALDRRDLVSIDDILEPR